jgi:hypothetical protein
MVGIKLKPGYKEISDPTKPEIVKRVEIDLLVYNKIRDQGHFNLPEICIDEDEENQVSFDCNIQEIGECILELVQKNEEEKSLDGRSRKITRYGWRLTAFFQAGGVGWEPPYTDDAILADGVRTPSEAVVKARHEAELLSLDNANQCEEMAAFFSGKNEHY